MAAAVAFDAQRLAVLVVCSVLVGVGMANGVRAPYKGVEQ
jgi:hypothetical protein